MREFGADARIEAPFHCAYGFNIGLGDGVFINAGCTILDTAPVHIGARTMLGPNVQIYCAEHHKDAVKRAAGLEIARPVDIGEDVWIGGGAIILAGVRIGAAAIVGAGAVVTRDVAGGTTVVGNPARPIPHFVAATAIDRRNPSCGKPCSELTLIDRSCCQERNGYARAERPAVRMSPEVTDRRCRRIGTTLSRPRLPSCFQRRVS